MALAAVAPLAAIAAVKIGESLVREVGSFSKEKLKEADQLMNRLNIKEWDNTVTYDMSVLPAKNLDKYLDTLTIPDNVKTQIKLSAEKNHSVKKIHFSAPDMHACYAIVAYYNDGANVTIMYCIYELKAVLVRSAAGGGIAGWVLSKLTSPSEKYEITLKERELLEDTFMPHQVMKEVEKKKVVKAIQYTK